MQTSQENKNQPLAHKNSTPESKLLVIERKYNVPVDQLFKAFTSAEALKQWWWPKDLYTDHVEIDFREGGRYFINMKGHDKGGGGMTGEFVEIVKDELILMTDYFSDENGAPISAAQANMIGAWPGVVYITFDFEAVGENASRFTLSQQGIPNELQEDCHQGWSESFDKLVIYLDDQKH